MRTIKKDIVAELFAKGDDVSSAAASEILRLRQIIRKSMAIYYSSDISKEEERYQKIFRTMYESFSVNPNYPDFY